MSERAGISFLWKVVAVLADNFVVVILILAQIYIPEKNSISLECTSKPMWVPGIEAPGRWCILSQFGKPQLIGAED